jgi:hypothetical protein
VWDRLDSAVTEMANVARQLRRVTSEHDFRVGNTVADFDSRYVHMAVMSQACSKMDGVAEKLKMWQIITSMYLLGNHHRMRCKRSPLMEPQ